MGQLAEVLCILLSLFNYNVESLETISTMPQSQCRRNEHDLSRSQQRKRYWYLGEWPYMSASITCPAHILNRSWVWGGMRKSFVWILLRWTWMVGRCGGFSLSLSGALGTWVNCYRKNTEQYQLLSTKDITWNASCRCEIPKPCTSHPMGTFKTRRLCSIPKSSQILGANVILTCFMVMCLPFLSRP